MRSLRLNIVQLVARLFSIPISIRSEFYGAEIGCSKIVAQPRLAIAAEPIPGGGPTIGNH
jgi:hypothetical protein